MEGNPIIYSNYLCKKTIHTIHTNYDWRVLWKTRERKKKHNKQ